MPFILKETTVQKVRNSGELVEGSSILDQTIGPETIIRDHEAGNREPLHSPPLESVTIL